MCKLLRDFHLNSFIFNLKKLKMKIRMNISSSRVESKSQFHSQVNSWITVALEQKYNQLYNKISYIIREECVELTCVFVNNNKFQNRAKKIGKMSSLQELYGKKANSHGTLPYKLSRWNGIINWICKDNNYLHDWTEIVCSFGVENRLDTERWIPKRGWKDSKLFLVKMTINDPMMPSCLKNLRLQSNGCKEMIASVVK